MSQRNELRHESKNVGPNTLLGRETFYSSWYEAVGVMWNVFILRSIDLHRSMLQYGKYKNIAPFNVFDGMLKESK